jgi:hypothetical protein
VSATFLTSEELEELTGFKANHCQVRWLERHGWRFFLTRKGAPRVARGHFNQRMGCGDRVSRYADDLNHAAATIQPNFAFLDRR